MIEDATIDETAKIPFPDLVNIYRCRVGAKTFIGPFVEIQAGAIIGACCKIQSHSFICDKVKIEDDVFIGHGVTFTNDRYPRVGRPSILEPTVVCKGATIGSGATILPAILIGEGALVGAGSVVTKNVKPHSVVAGNPAQRIEAR